MIPYVLVALGLCLILLEFYLPGAIMGILGGILIFVGIALFASQSTSIIAIILFMIVTVICVVCLIRFAIWRIAHGKLQDGIYSNANQEGFQASSFDEKAIGKIGIVISDLKPGGYILVDGRQQQAISISGYISKGAQVTVISGQEESLIVTLNNKELTS